MNTSVLRLLCIVSTLGLSVSGTRAQTAPLPQTASLLQITDKGVMIENGGLKCRMGFPLPINAAKVKGKVMETSPLGTGMLIKYEGGGQLDLQLVEGGISLRATDLPDDTRNLFITMRMGTGATAGGTWEFGSKSGTFPDEATSGQIYQGNAKSLVMAVPAGEGISMSLPATAFQQLMDLRQFQTGDFFWQCWLPYTKGTDAIHLMISEATGTPATPSGAATATKPSPEPAPAAKNETEKKPASSDRQKWGQLKLNPKDNKQSGTRVLKWKDGKHAAFLLGFDDNGMSHVITVIPELEKRKMVGNFYVNPGNGLWKKYEALWRDAAQSPYVALHNHTFLHTGAETVEGFEEDVLKTSEVIYGLTPQLKKPRIITFRQPGGVKWKISKEETKAVLAKHQMFNRPWLDGPPLSMKSLPEVLAPVEYALSTGGTGFVDFHGIGGDSNVAPTEWFMALLDKLDEHRDQFWIADTTAWYQYQQERKNAELKTVKSDASEVRLSLTCTLDPAMYDLPLTLAVEVPAEWKACTVTQGAKTWQATAESGQIQFDALAGADEIIVNPL